jgi:haloalkane dehalogenase
MAIPFLRTPESRFTELGIDLWPVHYVDIEGLRMAYSDEGSGQAGTMLLLHGEPTWGILYHRMFDIFVNAGWRLIIPDLIGFGRSDKPVNRSDHTYANHVRWVATFLKTSGVLAISEDLSPDHGFCAFFQDWGGLIGLRVVAENPDLFDKLILANTVLPDGYSPMSEGFMNWQNASQTMPEMDPGRLIARNCERVQLSDAMQDANRAPFPDETYMAGARELPMMVPVSDQNPAIPANRAAWEVFENWTRPVLTTWNVDDRVLGEYNDVFIKRIPGANGQPHKTYSPGGHFIQEDCGELVASDVVSWLKGLK